jgi:hypothetical protein
LLSEAKLRLDERDMSRRRSRKWEKVGSVWT